MYKATMYSRFNKGQQIATKSILDRYGHLIKWKKDILDIGCAEGSSLMNVILPAIFVKDISVTGIDQSAEMIKKAKETFSGKNLEFLHLRIDDKNLPQKINKTFDNIISFHVLHHVKNQETTFKNIYELLKPDGQLFFVRMPVSPFNEVCYKMSMEPNAPDYLRNQKYCDFYRQVKYDHSLIIEKTRRFLMKNGFTDVKCAIESFNYKVASYEEFFAICISVHPIWKDIPQHLKGSHLQDFLSKLLQICVKFDINEDSDKVDINLVFEFLVTAASKS